jgi:hypothetical protein
MLQRMRICAPMYGLIRELWKTSSDMVSEVFGSSLGNKLGQSRFRALLTPSTNLHARFVQNDNLD